MADDNHWSMAERENIDKLNVIRKEMAEGKHPAHCLNCWREESKGIDSLRKLALKSDWWHPYTDRINETHENGSTDI
jgi:hypothetical protein